MERNFGNNDTASIYLMNRQDPLGANCQFIASSRFFHTPLLTLATMLAFCLSVALPIPCRALASTATQRLQERLGPEDAVLLTDQAHNILFAHRPDKLAIPASTLKLLTALAAFHHLGLAYRFRTDFYQGENGSLKVKGYGDPMLISEELEKITAVLSSRLAHCGDIVLDDSFFEKPITIPGASEKSTEPYDAPVGALCVNFNTVYFTTDEKGAFISAEPQTPLLPFVMERIRESSLRQGRIILFQERDEAARYAGHLFAHFLQKAGVDVSGRVTLGLAYPDKDRLLYRHESTYTLGEVVAGMLEYSNNFIANQLLLAVGAQNAGAPASLEKGLQAVRQFAGNTLRLKDFSVAEGSGLSRKNRISARDMDRVLVAFEKYRHLMKKEGHQYYKTGTLKNIRTRVGYFESDNGDLYRFVVFLNGPGKTTHRIMNGLRKMIR